MRFAGVSQICDLGGIWVQHAAPLRVRLRGYVLGGFALGGIGVVVPGIGVFVCGLFLAGLVAFEIGRVLGRWGVFKGSDALGQVTIGARPEGEVDRRADEGRPAWLDAVLGSKLVEQPLDRERGALLEAQGRLAQGFLAKLAELGLKLFVLVEPAAEGAFADFGTAGGCDERTGVEQGRDGAFLAVAFTRRVSGFERFPGVISRHRTQDPFV